MNTNEEPITLTLTPDEVLAQARAINDRMEKLAAQPLTAESAAEMHALGSLARKSYELVHAKRIAGLN